MTKTIENVKIKIKEILDELKTDGLIEKVEITDTGELDYTSKKGRLTAVLFPAYLVSNDIKSFRKNSRKWAIDIFILWKTGKGNQIGFNEYERTVESFLDKFDKLETLNGETTTVSPTTAPPLRSEANEDYILAGISLEVTITKDVK